MAGNPDDYRSVPGDTIKYYDWTEDEVLAAKAYFLKKDPSLWGDLKKIELDPEIKTFSGTDPDMRANRLLAELHPDWQSQQLGPLWSKLRKLWMAEISTQNSSRGEA